MSLTELDQALATGLERAYVVVGDAAPLVERGRAAVEAAVRPKLGPVAFNLGRYRASDAGVSQALVAARTLPMMASTRLVEIRDLQEGSADFFAALVDYLKAPSGDTVLLAVGSGFPKVEKGGNNWAVRVKAALKGVGRLVTLSADAVPPAKFAIEVAGKHGKTLSPADAERLVDAVGADLGRLEQEVAKLALYVGDGPAIDADAIGSATAVVADAVIWDLTAGLAARDADVALEALHRLQASGDDARKLLGMILWQMRELLRASELVARGRSDREVLQEVKLRWDLMRKVRPMLEQGFPDAAELLRRLATANRHMNSHAAGAERILEGLVLEMLEGRLRRPPPVPRPR